MTLAISGTRRPKRSASTPNSNAPTGRSASVAVVVKMMAFLETLNSRASVSYKKTITKKSNASSIQPRKPARTAWYVPALRTGAVIRLDAPLVGLWHKPIQCHTAGHRHQPQHRSCRHSAKTELSNREEGRVNKHAASDPAKKILAQILRRFLDPAQFCHRLPSKNVGPHLAIELHQHVSVFRPGDQRNRHPHQRGDARGAQSCLGKDHRVGAREWLRTTRNSHPQGVAVKRERCHQRGRYCRDFAPRIHAPPVPPEQVHAA